MTFLHKVTAMIAAFLLLLPVCDCGAVIFTQAGASNTSCCPCEDCHGDDEEDKGCGSEGHSQRKYLADSQNNLFAVSEKEESSPDTEMVQIPPRTELYVLVGYALIEPPPFSTNASLWVEYCSYLL